MVLESLSTFKGRGEEAEASIAGRPNFGGGLPKSWVQTIDCLFLLGTVRRFFSCATIRALPKVQSA